MKTNQKENLNVGKSVRIIFIGVALFMVLALGFTVVSFVLSYRSQLNSRAEELANLEIQKVAADYETYVNSILREAQVISEKAALCTTELEFSYFLENLSDHSGSDNTYSDDLAGARFIKDGELYTSTASKYGFSTLEVMNAIEGIDSIHMVGVYYDASQKMNLSVVVIPYGNDFCDKILLYYAPSMFEEASIEVEDNVASYLSLCRKDGTITNTFIEFSYISSGSIMGSLEGRVTSTSELAELSSVTKFTKESALVHIGTDTYVVIQKNVGTPSNLYVVGIYDCASLYESEYTFYSSVSSILILFLSIAMILAIAMASHYLREKVFNKSEHRNVIYECLSQSGFIYEASNILKENPTSKFVVIVAQIRFFKTLQMMSGDMDKKVARTIRAIFSKMVQDREVYGYDSNGKFYLLFHYSGRAELDKRMKVVNKLCKKVKINEDKKLSLFYGVAETKPEEDVLTTVEHANEALRNTEDTIGINTVTFYDKEEKDDTLDREFIEMNVEKALKAGDFKVFYQPKYNIKKNRIDGSEALVRWYMPKENRFYPPGTFLPIIESNGFIVKVDHYVFEQVCEYLRHSLDTGVDVYPVSVNVSRMTLIQEDFVSFYKSVKEKYKIRTGLLTLEITESASFEDYKTLEIVIDSLHAAGFMCSIDDFGTGFSSYNCLKKLKMDEIKLDRFFLEEGIEHEADIEIIKSVVALGKSIGMKVTQEGVETHEQLNFLKEIGCDVIQGYLYSKPIPLADYISFTDGQYHGAFN